MSSENTTKYILKSFYSAKDPCKKYEIISTSESDCPSLIVTLANTLGLKGLLSLGSLDHIDEDSLISLIGKYVSEILHEDLAQSVERVKNLNMETILSEIEPINDIPQTEGTDNNDEGDKKNLNICQLLNVLVYTKEQLEEKISNNNDIVQEDVENSEMSTIETQKNTIGILINENNAPMTIIKKQGMFYILNVQDDAIESIWKKWDDNTEDFDCDINRLTKSEVTPQTEEIVQQLLEENQVEIPPIEQLQEVHDEVIPIEHSDKIDDEVIPVNVADQIHEADTKEFDIVGREMKQEVADKHSENGDKKLENKDAKEEPSPSTTAGSKEPT